MDKVIKIGSPGMLLCGSYDLKIDTIIRQTESLKLSTNWGDRGFGLVITS